MLSKIFRISALILTARLTAAGQCSFPATLTATPNACLGSTIDLSSTHALTKIAWYRDGSLVANNFGTTGPGALTSTPDSIPTPGTHSTPLGFAVDDNGNIYFTTNEGNVVKWSPASNTWTTIGEALGGEGGCAIDKAGNVYLARGDGSVVRLGPGAATEVVIAGGNGFGSNANQFASPQGIALDCEGNLYVVDQINARVQRWAPGATTGVTVAGGNGSGAAANQLGEPVAVFVDNNDNLIINDFTPTSRLQRWAAGATTGTTLLSQQLYPQMAGAWGTFVDGKGNIYGGLSYNLRLLFLSQPTTIDNTYQPAAGGKYWAVVTDINGYTSMSDTLVISPPPAGPPSIQVSAAATSLYLCQADSFTASPTNAGLDPTYQWQVSGVNVGGDSTTWSNNLFANGDRVYCIMTTIGTACEQVSDTSNISTLSVDPRGHATVTIAASDSAVCVGTPITFTATVINGSGNPGFDWWVNGRSTGFNAPAFADTATGNQVVYCEITSDASCGLAKSNSIPIAIYPIPTVPDQLFNVRQGESLTLDPEINGDVSAYLWIPGYGLSDSAIRNPIADPPATTAYSLIVTSPGGCKAKGDITVYVYTPLSMPNAFTPNGDGHNDRLYVTGGPTGSTVHVFAIFDRWGARIFSANDIAPGDASHAWDGTIGGRPAPAGTYVYMVVMTLPGDHRQVYRGTVELIR